MHDEVNHRMLRAISIAVLIVLSVWPRQHVRASEIVESGGFEPPFLRCERSVLPLDDDPVVDSRGFEPRPPERPERTERRVLVTVCDEPVVSVLEPQ